MSQYEPSKSTKPDQRESLRLFSLNLQVGISNSSLAHYMGSLWQHLLPSSERHKNLERVGRLIRSFDLIALQEIDGGSFRTGFHNQTLALSHFADLKYWHVQTNRDFGYWAQHSNAVLCRFPLKGIIEHQLPGFLPGRGAIEVDLEFNGKNVTVFIAHLALGKRTQQKQLAFLAELIQNQPNCILMGDLNASGQWLMSHSPLKKTNLVAQEKQHTYPSWRPKKDLDHILVSSSMQVNNFQVLDHKVSDHLPIALDVSFKH